MRGCNIRRCCSIELKSDRRNLRILPSRQDPWNRVAASRVNGG